MTFFWITKYFAIFFDKKNILVSVLKRISSKTSIHSMRTLFYNDFFMIANIDTFG